MNKNIYIDRSMDFILPLFTNIGDWEIPLLRESLLTKVEISQGLFFNIFFWKNLDICKFIVGGVDNSIGNHLMLWNGYSVKFSLNLLMAINAVQTTIYSILFQNMQQWFHHWRTKYLSFSPQMVLLFLFYQFSFK